MKALLLKDFYQTVKYGKSILLLSVLFALSSLWMNGDKSFLVIYPSILAGMFPYTLLSLDEKEGWNRFCETLPANRSQFVSVKYLIGFLFGLVVSLVMVCVQAVRMLFSSGSLQLTELLYLFVVLIGISMFALSFNMPFVLKMGVDRGRLWYMMSLIVFFGLGGGVSAVLIRNEKYRMLFHGSFFLWAAVIVVLLICAGSWLLSVSFYKRREL